MGVIAICSIWISIWLVVTCMKDYILKLLPVKPIIVEVFLVIFSRTSQYSVLIGADEVIKEWKMKLEDTNRK
jgi:hypothetical protein